MVLKRRDFKNKGKISIASRLKLKACSSICTGPQRRSVPRIARLDASEYKPFPFKIIFGGEFHFEGQNRELETALDLKTAGYWKAFAPKSFGAMTAL